jgi:K+-sensing histidine kinase KdpD
MSNPPLSPRRTHWGGNLIDHGKSSIVPVAIAFATIVLTTYLLVWIDAYLATEHLLLVYLLPITFVATYFGSTIALLTSCASGLAAAYFLLPPKFSFQIADPLSMAELGFIMLLAVTASKAVSALTRDIK